MDFKKSGIPGLLISEPFENFIDALDDLDLDVKFGYFSLNGSLFLEGKKYFINVEKEERSKMVESIELNSIFGDDYFEGIHISSSTIDSFMEALAAKGSTPIYQDSGIWWPKERISFYIYEDVPRSICWWGENITSESVRSIFSS